MSSGPTELAGQIQGRPLTQGIGLGYDPLRCWLERLLLSPVSLAYSNLGASKASASLKKKAPPPSSPQGEDADGAHLSEPGYFFSGSFLSSFFSAGLGSSTFQSLLRSLRWSFILRCGMPSVIQAGAGLSMSQWSNHSFIRTV